MPSSWIDQVPVIVQSALKLNPKRILDIGLGSGKYGFLMREQTDFALDRPDRKSWKLTIDGVEGYGPNIGDHQKSIYNNITVSEGNKFLKNYTGEKYDLTMAIDIIEHFTPEGGLEFANSILKISDYFLLSTPRGYFRQLGHENELEQHKSWWPSHTLNKLAKHCDAQIKITRVHMSNVAVLSKNKSIPDIGSDVTRNVLRFIRDLIIPETIYYKLINGTGPTI